VRDGKAQQRLPRQATDRRRWPRRRWVLVAAIGVVAVAAAVVAVLAGGSGPTGPRALTSDEANRLAITRFRNYQAGGRAVTITVPSAGGGLVITGSVDYRAKLGYGVVHGSGRDTSSDGLVQWTASTVLVHPMANAPAAAPATPPGSGWFSRPLQSAGSSLDSALAIALSLGSDRPDNAELLPQNGATWVGQDEVAGHQVDVLTGPRTRAVTGTAGDVRYWIGSDGTAYRVRARVASEPDPVVVDFDTQGYQPVQPVPGAGPTR
jgi:type II secretory pathway pseudopilin PulG